MSTTGLFEPERLELAGVISALLDKGVVLRGEADISIADIDLIRLDLGALLVAVETELQRRRDTPSLAAAMGPPELTPARAALVSGMDAAQESAIPAAEGAIRAAGRPGTSEVSLQEVAPALPRRVNVDPEGVQNGLARLALTLIEVLRKVLEHQAIRRMEGGSLSGEEIEKLGLGLLRLHDQMQELKAVFGLTDEELQIDLGPLGRVR